MFVNYVKCVKVNHILDYEKLSNRLRSIRYLAINKSVIGVDK